MPVYLSRPPSNPLTRLLAALIGVLVLVGAFMLGIVALAIVAGLGTALWVAARLRIGWIKRQLPARGQDTPSEKKKAEIIEAEYTVVSRRRE